VRVLHVQKAKGIGGSERHLLALLPALAERGVETRMCVLRTGEGHQFVHALAGAGVDVSVLDAGRDVAPTLVTRLRREIQRFRPDVVHTHLVHADLHGLLAARSLGVPAVSSVHGTPAFYCRQPYRSVGRLSGRLAARRIAISEHVARFLLDNGLTTVERVRVVPYGIRAVPVASPATRLRARATFGLDGTQTAFGIAARLIPGKGHDSLLTAFGQVSRDDPSLVLLVAGDGPEREQLEHLAAARCPAGTVRFLGFLESVDELMTACDVLVFPTDPELSEGFGLAALEAMAAGRPVIATDVGSLPEVVVDGVTGLVVGARSTAALADAISTLTLDVGLRGRMGEAGAVRALGTFPLSRMADRTVGVYEELL
jgi:glycosyltransferase involved in cell wall biosynthesis